MTPQAKAGALFLVGERRDHALEDAAAMREQLRDAASGLAAIGCASSVIALEEEAARWEKIGKLIADT